MWQDIATAPKDGTEIILGAQFYVGTGHWARPLRGWIESVNDEPIWEGSSGRGGLRSPDREPTHWMPLPAPPA